MLQFIWTTPTSPRRYVATSDFQPEFKTKFKTYGGEKQGQN